MNDPYFEDTIITVCCFFDRSLDVGCINNNDPHKKQMFDIFTDFHFI